MEIDFGNDARLRDDPVILDWATCQECGQKMRKYIGSATSVLCAECCGEFYLLRVGVGNTRPTIPIADLQYKGSGPFVRRFSQKA